MTPAIWGLIMISVGLFFVTNGCLKSEFFLYRLFVARSEKLWKGNVHLFLLLFGVAITLAGFMMAIGWVD